MNSANSQTTAAVAVRAMITMKNSTLFNIGVICSFSKWDTSRCKGNGEPACVMKRNINMGEENVMIQYAHGEEVDQEHKRGKGKKDRTFAVCFIVFPR